jgi:hypothetical protein
MLVTRWHKLPNGELPLSRKKGLIERRKLKMLPKRRTAENMDIPPKRHHGILENDHGGEPKYLL